MRRWAPGWRWDLLLAGVILAVAGLAIADALWSDESSQPGGSRSDTIAQSSPPPAPGNSEAIPEEADLAGLDASLLPQFWSAYSAGDVARAAAFFTEYGVWKTIDPVGTSVAGGREAFAAVGRDAIEVSLAHYCCGLPGAVQYLGRSGNTLSGRATPEGGGIIETFTVELDEGKFVLFRRSLDLADPATARYYEGRYEFWQRGKPPPSPSDVIIALGSDEGGQAGNVILTPASAGWQPSPSVGDSPVDRVASVIIDTLPGPTGVHQPAHIHAGSCDDLGPIVFKLASVVDGRSLSLVSTSLAELLAGDFAIDVHASEEESRMRIACGNIPEDAA